MSERQHATPMTDAERRAVEAARELPGAAPDPAWRGRLGDAFARGAVPEGPFSTLIAVPDPADDGEEPTPHVIPLPRRFRPSAPWLLAAAAAAVIAVVWFGRAPDWQVVGATPGGQLTLGSQRIALTDTKRLRARIARGGALRLEGGRLWLRAPGAIAIEVTPGTVATLPSPPSWLFGRSMTARVGSGELRITTGPRFHGARLEVMTPEARVEVTGTTLAVIREPAGTCVCVYEGRVMVGPVHGDMQWVTGGDRRFVFADGHTPEHAAMRDTERPELARLRAAQRPEMEAGR
jgi:ferric-dicitrate binding protein FerR (iron transport regulator)